MMRYFSVSMEEEVEEEGEEEEETFYLTPINIIDIGVRTIDYWPFRAAVANPPTYYNIVMTTVIDK